MGDRRENLAFGQRIRAAMAVARVSRQDVARACGISPQGVQRWCDGTSYPSSSKLITFCNMTGCSAEWLLWQHPVDIRSTDWAMCWFFLGLGLVIGGVVGWNLGFLEGQGAAIVALVGDAP